MMSEHTTYRVGVKIPMDVGHFLVGDFGEESAPHRHDYEVELRCAVAGLDENGFSVDIAYLKELLGAVACELAGVLLNDLPWFADRQPSVEHLAGYVDERLRAVDHDRGGNAFDHLLESEVRVWEDPNAWASYRVST